MNEPQPHIYVPYFKIKKGSVKEEIETKNSKTWQFFVFLNLDWLLNSVGNIMEFISLTSGCVFLIISYKGSYSFTCYLSQESNFCY